MPRTIRITVGDCELSGELNDSATAGKIWDVLPLAASFNTWGDEIYFATSVQQGPEDPRETVDLGDLSYWPPGKAFCIFYGKTPASEGDEIRPASPVNPIGRVTEGDVTALREAAAAGQIRVEKLEE